MGNLLLWIILGVLWMCLPVTAADRAKAWDSVQKAKNGGFPKTAIEELNPIIEGAIADQKFGEALKALCCCEKESIIVILNPKSTQWEMHDARVNA